jgi:hypothetical protein
MYDEITAYINARPAKRRTRAKTDSGVKVEFEGTARFGLKYLFAGA